MLAAIVMTEGRKSKDICWLAWQGQLSDRG